MHRRGEVIRLEFTFRVEYEITQGADPCLERGAGGGALGFTPAFLDFQTFTIHSSRFASGALAARTRLIPGFMRGGFFYTRRAAQRAAREWVPRPMTGPALSGAG